jgi:hypothetical protein
MAAGGGALVFPVDLRHYCGYAPGGGPGGPGTAGAARCCFLSGRQCARCGALTAAAEGEPLAARVDACRKSLERYLPALTGARPGGGSGSGSGSGGTPKLGPDAAAALAEGARLYTLQRAGWHEAGGGGAAAAAAAAALLAPLREVEALRQVQFEQGPGAFTPAWPAEAVEDMAWDALEAALAAAPAAAAAHGGGEGGNGSSGSGGGGARMSIDAPPAPPPARPEEFEFEPEALEALAAGAEALLAAAFERAQAAALAAGRQEVGPSDLRAALRAAGLGHLLPADTTGAREEAAADAVLPGLL